MSVRAEFARAVVDRTVSRFPVRLAYPGGRIVGGGDETSPLAEIRDPRGFFDRLARDPKIGFGEAYMSAAWGMAAGHDLAAFLEPFARRPAQLLPGWMMRLRRLADSRMPAAQRNTRTGARRNIAAHYDLSNELFAAFLDETLTYSSALFEEFGEPLATAQRRKVEAALDRAGVRAGSHVLEIGTGWGQLALQAAARGAQVTTITLSREQLELARERVAAAGVADHVELRLEDYRDTTGRYDAVVSIEMIEAVGDEFWPVYFAAIDERLVPGGRACVQAILMEHDRYLATRDSFGWIRKHIFPGGMIPSLEAITAITEHRTRLGIEGVRRFGDSYAETLRRWRARFLEHHDAVARLGFDERFARMWEFYLAYCEAGFAARYLDVAQIEFVKRP